MHTDIQTYRHNVPVLVHGLDDLLVEEPALRGQTQQHLYGGVRSEQEEHREEYVQHNMPIVYKCCHNSI